MSFAPFRKQGAVKQLPFTWRKKKCFPPHKKYIAKFTTLCIDIIGFEQSNFDLMAEPGLQMRMSQVHDAAGTRSQLD